MPTERFLKLKEEKKRRILDAAFREFSRAPFREASINRIIKDAEISRGSFYTYFEDKTDLLQIILRDGVQSLTTQLYQELEVSGGDYFQALNGTFSWFREKLGLEDNLAVRAARLMCGAFSLTDRLTISLDKRIPMAAGMAGGSTDAAAVMLCIRDLYGLDCSLSRLQELAVTLGADIPYCLAGGTKLCEGIGEILTALPDAPQMQVLIAKPEAGASTGGIYRRYDSLPAEAIQHPDTEAMLAAIRANDAAAMARECRNVLEAVTAPEVPQIGRIEEICMEGGALAARMTGSGPTVFALFDDVKKAWKTAELLAGEKELPGLRVYKTGFIYEI